MTLLLVDKSAYARGLVEPSAADLCVCAVTRFEILFSARSRTDYERIDAGLDRFRELRMNAETFSIARGAHRELASVGQHRISLPDLLIAACAHQHGADVLHVDRHFDVLAQVLSFTPHRAA